MRIYSTNNYEAMGEKAADIIAAHMILKPDSVLGFATGSTPLSTYESLVRRAQQGTIDFSLIRTFNLDEYVGLSADSDQSYRYFMNHNLFDKVNIPTQNVDFLQGMTADAAGECQRYEEHIDSLGGIDLQLLGLGHNGHIAFNEPSDRFEPKTFKVELTQSTIDANKRFFASESEVPRQALTMGIGTIMRARKIIVIVSGADKAEITRQVVSGPITPQVPASILQLHSDVTLIGDTEALAYL